MKKKLLIFSLFYFLFSYPNIVRIGPYPGSTNNEIQESDEMVDIVETTSKETKGSCDFSQQIIQQANIGTTPFLSANPPFRITVPGQYCVTTNISVPANTNGIIIDSNNVFLDLQNKCITGQSNSGIGILIMGTNRNNITIRNGAIFTMGNNGIQMNNGGQQIFFENLELCGNNGIGLSLAGIRNLIINNCIFSFNTNNGLSIIQFGTRVSQNCIINNCLATFNTLNGLFLAGCSNFQITNVNASNNNNIGFNEGNGNRIQFQFCEANTNRSHGFFSAGLGHSFEECIANNNNGVGIWATGSRLNLTECQTKGNMMDGFRLSGNNDTVTNSSSMNNTQIGFNISGNQHSYEQCDSKQNNIGFQIGMANHCILNCLSKNNMMFGFLMLPNSTQCQIRSNTAVANNTVGFQNNTTTVNRIYSNFSSDNGPGGVVNFVGIPNVFTSPVPADAINFTTNISN